MKPNNHVRYLFRTAALAACTAASFWAPAGSGAESGPRVSEPFHYSGYTSRLWSGYRRSSQYVVMRDGTRIAVTTFLPTGYVGADAPPEAFPVIFDYTPYAREPDDPATGKIASRASFQFFLSYGYAVVAADMRGTGASFGWMNQRSRVVCEDGKELVDWIAAQPWSTGKVGMMGGSYEAWSQLGVASMKPKALKAIVPKNPTWEEFKMHPGGILSYAFMQMWSGFTYHLNRGTVFPLLPTFYPSPPVDGKDGNGERLAAIREHEFAPGGAPGTFDGFTVAKAQEFWDSRRPGDGTTAPDTTWAMTPGIVDSGVAVLNVVGWFDPSSRSSFELYATLAGAGRNPSRIVAIPSYHQGISKGFAESIGARGEADLAVEQLRWFDRWLKGIDNGVDRENPVVFFEMNGGWRTAATWPVSREPGTKFFLDADRTLSRGTAPAANGGDRYKSDFTCASGWDPPLDTGAIAEVNRLISRAAPVSETFRRNRYFMYGYPEGPPIRTEMDRKALTYTTPPLGRDTDVIGHPEVHLWASSTAGDGDFFLYLEDVDASGQAVLVTEYMHRAGFAHLEGDDEIIPHNPGIKVRPELPWQGFKRSDYNANVFANGGVAEIVTALFPTAWRFRKGHSIRLTITAADWPAFELNPRLSPANRPDAPDNVVPTVTLWRGGIRASYVELPVMR